MCGIGGLLVYPKDRGFHELQYIRYLATEIMVANEARGTDAAGMVAFNRQGKHRTQLMKQPIKASELAEAPYFKKFRISAITQDTANILVHTRHATKGDPSNNANNHPIETYSCVGVHNGWLRNDDKLFEELKMPRQAQVDSEAIFRLVDLQGKNFNSAKVVDVAEKLSGAFTFAFCRKYAPHKMYVVRKDNPITMVYIPVLNIIAFASLKGYLEDAIKKANQHMSYTQFPAILEADCTFGAPYANHIYTFDTSKDAAEEQFKQTAVRFTPSYEYDSYAYGWEWDDAGYFGSEQIMTTTTNSQIKDTSSEMEFILRNRLTDQEYEMLEDYIESLKGDAWTEGYREGRKSLADEIDAREGMAFEKGYKSALEAEKLG